LNKLTAALRSIEIELLNNCLLKFDIDSSAKPRCSNIATSTHPIQDWKLTTRLRDARQLSFIAFKLSNWLNHD